ncbi:hypothetical protein EV210_11745 [Anaerospora hongkongensis]|uniref:Uncharacterized protein n=1 Tax=Anaerospora hongkongensis TaxID=244830 RepID=A0A4R1PU24_9FIRM|nr:hypothetical protein [Anaerospora hongkongensis]TCL33587.1 hypothetical protein EV210_11745 [Anaerospora hongkongensis]
MSEDTVQVKIEADSSGFSGALKDAMSSLTDMVGEMKNGFGEMTDAITTSMKEASDASSIAAQNISAGIEESAVQTAQSIRNLSQALKGLKPEMENTASAKGIAGSMKDAMQSVIGLTDSITNLKKPLVLLNDIYDAIDNMKKAMLSGGLTAAFRALAGAMNISPLVLAVTASITLLAGCVYLVYTNWEEFKGWCIGLWNGIVDLIANNIGLIMALFPGLGAIIYLVYEYWNDAVQAVSGLWTSFTKFLDEIVQVVKRIIDSVSEAWPRFVDGAQKGVSKFADALASLVGSFIPNWAKSLWSQVVSLGNALAAKTAEIGNAIRKNLKISGEGGNASVGEDGNADESLKKPELPKFMPAMSAGSFSSGGRASGQDKSEYENAKKLYDQQLRLADYTATEKEALYKKYLENVQKSDQEAIDYKIGLYQVEKNAFAEMLKGQEADLQNAKTRGLVTELQYHTELAEIKRKNLDAEVAFRAKAAMEAEKLSEAEKTQQLAAYKEKVEATVWYKQALKEVLNAEKTLADYQLSIANKINDFRKQVALDSIAAEENRLHWLYEQNLISQEKLTAALKTCEEQRYEMEKASLERSLNECAKDAGKMQEIYQRYVDARDQATREMIMQEIAANGKSADEAIRILNELYALKVQHEKKEQELERSLVDEKIKKIRQISDSLKDSMSQAFQDVLTRQANFLDALKSIWSTTMKSILKQFTDTISQTIIKKAFDNQIIKNDEKDIRRSPKKNVGNQAKVVTEKAAQAQLTAANAQGNAQRLAQDRVSGQQQIMTRGLKAEAEQAIETTKDTNITASAQAAGQASVASIQSAITAMIEMLPMLILMSVLTGMFGGGGSKTTESTGPGINLGRNPDSYYSTPTLTGIPSFDVGSWRLPADTLAMVHKDEMIVPAKGGLADGMRDLLGSGGGQSTPTINLNYSAAHYGRTNKDVQAEIKQNARFLVKALGTEHRNFNRGKK